MWNKEEFRFQTTLDDLKKDDIVVVETKYGIALAKVTRYGVCEKPEMLKKVLTKVEI